MPKKRFGAEQIVALLRQIEVATAQGKTIGVACREAGTPDIAARWARKKLGGIGSAIIAIASSLDDGAE